MYAIYINCSHIVYNMYFIVCERGIKKSLTPMNLLNRDPPPLFEISGSAAVRGFSLCRNHHKFYIAANPSSSCPFLHICVYVICRLFVHDEVSISLKLFLRLYDTVGYSGN